MLKSKLEILKQFILTNNTYFVAGYADVVQDDTTGIVHNGEPIFPNDSLGDYFYLRLPKNVTFSYDNQYRVSDCAASFGLSAQVILVACVRDADPDKLVGNLVTTVARYMAENIKLQQAIYQSDVVIAQELARTSESNIAAALQKRDENYTIVSLQFQYTTPYLLQPLKCITAPCSEC